jgi:glycosyltransferase involved in cell wall biosynthesis
MDAIGFTEQPLQDHAVAGITATPNQREPVMRLVYDLFPCQTGSRFRGIGRFTYSLAEAMTRLRGEHEVYALANGLYPESTDALRQDLGPLLPPGHFAAYTHTTPASLSGSGSAHAPIASALINHAYRALSPDAVIYATPFEGWREQSEAAVPYGTIPGALRVAVLYDFIPWLFPQQYLHNMNGYKQWYERRLAALHQFDLLLAISEATRLDAIDILGVSPERVVNISGAASPKFRLMQESRQASHHIARFGITRPFVLYTGNGDYRKNLDGMLQAYVRLPDALRKTHQLVLNQVGELHAFRRKMHAVGLSDEEVVVTGHITDNELISLYTRCKIFVFPSLYEGFGLPILEAMACGAPVIAANNSSIPEVVGRADVLFDATDPAAIAAALEKVLTNDVLRRELADYSIDRAKAFSWDRSATLAWAAIENALLTRRTVSADQFASPRLAMVCPLLPEASPAAAHCISLLPALARHFRIDLYMEESAKVDPSLLQSGFAIYPHTQLAARRESYFNVVYQMANCESHAFMLPLMEQFPGVLVLHDVRLDVPVRTLAQRPGMDRTYENEVLYCHGLQGLVAWLKDAAGAQPPLNRRVLESANHLLLTDAGNASLLKQAHGANWLPPMTILPTGDATTSAYVQAIHAAAGNDQTHTVRHLADALEGTRADDRALSAIAYHATSNWGLRKQPRILLDVSRLAQTDERSGIQRVVRNIAREMCSLGNLPLPVELVRQIDGKLRRANNVVASIFGMEDVRVPEQEMSIQPGDTLLMIDSSWDQYADFLPIFHTVRRRGGKIVTVVYDTIPLRTPEMCVPAVVAVFNRWFHLAIEQSDLLLCISRAVADDVMAYLVQQECESKRKLQINYWPLGADIAVSRTETAVRPQVRDITSDEISPLFLMVGTIEPRKGHELVLDAFDSLWGSGADIRLCIAGSAGWMVEKTMRRISGHPQFNKKLFLVEKFTDAEINLCYAGATALIAASVAEGYGLPIVEASLHKVPVLASDIPVFREVGGDGVIYFSLNGCEDLATRIVRLSAMAVSDRKAMASRVKVKTWRESAIHLLEIVLEGKHAYHHVQPPTQDGAYAADVKIPIPVPVARPQPLA